MATPLEQLKQAFDQGDLNVCETIIMRTRELKGEPSPQFHKLASNVFRKRESFLEALFHDQCIIKLRPNDPIGYYRSGQDLLNLSRAEEAAEQATEGLRHSGDHHPSLHLIAMKAYRSQKCHHQALKHAQALIQLTPEDPIGFIRACQDLIALDQAQAAKSVINAGLTQHQNNQDLLRIALQVATQTSDLTAAIQFSEHLLQAAPDNLENYTIAGRAILKSGDPIKAIKIVEAGLTIADDATLLRLGLEAARESRDHSWIMTLGTRLIEQNPEHECLIEYRKALRSTGLREHALQISQKIVEQSDTPTQDDIGELFSDHIVLGDINSALQVAKQTNLLSSEEQDRVKQLVQDKSQKQLDESDKKLLQRTQIFSQFERSTFNPAPQQILRTSQEKPTIALIHIGKCAGESLFDALHLNFSGNDIDLYEFHIFDANQRIQDLLTQSQSEHQIHWVISTRDPVQRWVSAFNWDSHTFHRSQQFACHPEAHTFHRRYPTAQSLAAGLSRREDDAIAYAQFHHLAYGHIAMGANWYLPAQTRQLLQTKQFSVIRTENIQADYIQSISAIKSQFQNLSDRDPVDVPRTKQSYQNRYPEGTFSSPSDLSANELAALKETILADIHAHQFLTKTIKPMN